MPRHRGMHWLAAVASAAFFCGSPTAWAESYTYQGHTLKYAVPPGYCLVNPQGVIGSQAFALMQKAAGDDVEFIVLYFDCEEFTSLAATHTTPIRHGGGIAIPKSGGSILVRDDETRRDEIDRQVAKFAVIDLAWVNTQLKLKAEERGVVFNELQDIRLIDHDSVAAYAALVDAPDSAKTPMISVNAMSLTNQLPIRNLMIAPATDPNVVQVLLDQQRRYMTWLIAQNETSEEQTKQMQPTPGLSLGGNMGAGSLTIGVLCLFGALWLVFRVLRS
jgi:hypothetical protein